MRKPISHPIDRMESFPHSTSWYMAVRLAGNYLCGRSGIRIRIPVRLARRSIDAPIGRPAQAAVAFGTLAKAETPCGAPTVAA